MAAPLLIGTDLVHATEETLAILGAPEVTAIDQDSLGSQGRRVAMSTSVTGSTYEHKKSYNSTDNLGSGSREGVCVCERE